MSAAESNAARLDLLQAYLQEDPANERLLFDIWQSAMDTGAWDLAASTGGAGALAGENASIWLDRQARACTAAGKFQQAAMLLHQAAEQGLPPARVDHGLASIAFLRGDLEGCVRIASPWRDRADAQDLRVQDELQALWLRAMHRLHRVDEAWNWIAAARAAAPLLPQVSGCASLVAIDADQFGSAWPLADSALAADPQHVEALLAKGCVALAQGHGAEARELLGCAEALHPADGRIQSALGMASLQARDVAGAQAHFERATATLPRHIGSWHGLGWCLLLQARHEDALQAFERALGVDPAFAESRGAIALVHALRGDFEGAREPLRHARKLDPRNVTAALAEAVMNGQVGPEQLPALARRLLDRPGFFGEKLSARWARAAGSGTSA